MVATAVAPAVQMDVQLNLGSLDDELSQRVACSVHRPAQGDPAPVVDVPGRQLKLDEMITNTYTLDQVNEVDMMANKNIRGVITFD